MDYWQVHKANFSSLADYLNIPLLGTREPGRGEKCWVYAAQAIVEITL